jgi:threonine/homoserine/homoserine lactone efflux protein
MYYLLSGIILGLIAGISPGPLLALVISETLMHGKKEGIKISLVPFITDFPAVLLSIFLLSRLDEMNFVLGTISLAGAIFLIYLAYGSITFKGMNPEIKNQEPRSLQKGIAANFLSPHPYLFWISVGTPILLKAYYISLLYAILFIASFYICLVGSKIIISVLVEKSKSVLSNKIYLYIIRGLGLALLVFAIIFINEGLRLLNIIF